MKYQLKFLFVALLLFAGCSSSVESYRVNLVKSDGDVYASYEVQSSRAPKLDSLWGGQTDLIYFTPMGLPRRALTAPSGWLVEVKKLETPRIGIE